MEATSHNKYTYGPVASRHYRALKLPLLAESFARRGKSSGSNVHINSSVRNLIQKSIDMV